MRTAWINLLSLIILGTALVSGCVTKGTSPVPSDFLFIMDVKSAGEFEGCVNVNIRLDAEGRGRYEVYDTGFAIEYDSNHMVTYRQNQVIKSSKLRLNNATLEQLWDAINNHNFFGLGEDYRMAMGYSYAFIVVEANGQRNLVDNIGMEVPEIRAIVERTDTIMPDGVNLDYGEGYLP